MWVSALFNLGEENESTDVGEILDVSATNELVISFPVDGWQLHTEVSEINGPYIALITNEAAQADLARCRAPVIPSSVRQRLAARQGPSSPTGPKKAIPRELQALLHNAVMLAHT